MAKSSQTVQDAEPVGIVISSGSRIEATPLFSAYVWGPAPEIVEVSVEAMVAA